MGVLVTGSNGFLGAALVDRLMVLGEQHVRCFVRPGSDLSRLRRIEAARGISLDIHTGNLGSAATASKALAGVQTLYHVAAGMKGAPADLFLNTVVASRNLLDAVVATNPAIRIVLVSSFGVYGTACLRAGSVLNEETPLEPYPERRDVYSFAKLRQEQLFWEYANKYGIPLVVVRPGVIFGPGGPALSSRIGLPIFGVFLHLGRSNRLPLTYVENCAEALVVAGRSEQAIGQALNVHDDDLPTCRQYLREYRKRVKPMRTLSLPYSATMLLSRAIENYSRRTEGQLPAVLTPYKVATSWKGCRFDNAKLKSLGWRQSVPTREALIRTFAALRS